MAAWKKLLQESLSKSMKEDKDSISYCLSTISRMESRAGDTHDAPGRYEYRPESRTVVHRGFVNERHRYGDPAHDEDPSSESMLVCTDVRSPKVDQLLLLNRPLGEASSTTLAPQSGPMASICWWFAPTGEQYRIQARAYVVAAETERGRVASLTGEQARRLGPRGGVGFDWEAERVRVYEKLSWELKASFVGHSAPGSKVVGDHAGQKPADAEKRLEQGDQQLRETALRHFALIVLEPVSVDLVRLKTNPHQRFSWKKTASEKWDESQLVP